MAEPTALDPRMKIVWTLIDAAIWLGVVVAVGIAALVISSGAPLPALLAAGVVTMAAVVHVRWWPRAAYEAWRYELSDENLELRHGVFFHTLSVIPYGRVQHVDTTKGPIDRMVGLSRLVVHTASASTDKVIPGVSDEAATGLRSALLARAGVDDV